MDNTVKYCEDVPLEPVLKLVQQSAVKRIDFVGDMPRAAPGYQRFGANSVIAAKTDSVVFMTFSTAFSQKFAFAAKS